MHRLRRLGGFSSGAAERLIKQRLSKVLKQIDVVDIFGYGQSHDIVWVFLLRYRPTK